MDSRYHLEADLAQRAREAHAIARAAAAARDARPSRRRPVGLRLAIGPLEVLVRVSRRPQPAGALAEA